MVGKVPALTTLAPDHEEAPADHQGVQMDDMELPTEDDESDEDEELHRTQCDAHTSCPKDATCCFMKSTQKWGCCPLPQVSVTVIVIAEQLVLLRSVQFRFDYK